jgi:hypothetical protein
VRITVDVLIFNLEASMRRMINALVAASMLAAPCAALADPGDNDKEWAKDRREAVRERLKDEREARREWEKDRREARKEWEKDRREAYKEARKDYREARRDDWRAYRNYDYDRVDPRYGGYYADRYYRDGSYYQPRSLAYNDRVYRGQDGRYYCRRPDGTTGLIIGGLAGGALGNVLAPGGSKTLGTIIGAVGGGIAGRALDRDRVTCR